MQADSNDPLRADFDQFDIATIGLDSGTDQVDDLGHAVAEIRIAALTRRSCSFNGHPAWYEPEGRFSSGAWRKDLWLDSDAMHQRNSRESCLMRLRVCVQLAAVGLVLAGCGGGSSRVADPLTDIRDPRLSEKRRTQAIEQVWAEAEAGKLDRITAREELKTVAWSAGWPESMRMTALRALASDTTEKGQADTRNMFRLMLPREPNRNVTIFLCATVRDRGWKDATPSLVRSLARVWPDVPDRERPEYAAINALNAPKTVQEVVYDVFLNPPDEGGAFGIVPADRVRADAWDLLARVDADGSARARLLEAPEASAESGPVADMRASLEELRCLPLSGDEIAWLSALRDFRNEQHRAWWEQTRTAIAGIDQQKAPKLQLRHLEPIYWASLNRTEWLSASREQLLSELRTRLQGREKHRRKAGDLENWRPRPETLAESEAKLSWADLLTILVIDDAVRQSGVVQSLFAQAAMDTEDKSAEYGGLVLASNGQTPAEAVLFPPRAAARRGDKQFVASLDMIQQGARALAHYHFHVQEVRNGPYAGPSPDDLNYAARYGRSCLVLTSVAAGALDIDYYQPDGIVIDLGDIRER